MDRNRLDDLLEKSASTDMAALLRAKEAAKQAMVAEPSAANVAAFERAARALEELLGREKGASAARAGAEKEGDEPRIRNRRQAAAWLRERGWKVADRTIYKHYAEGRIPREADGTFRPTALETYARAWLERVDESPADDDVLERLRQEKLQAETEKTKAQAAHWRLKHKIESGEYLPRDEVETALAARAQLLRRSYEDWAHAEAGRIVALLDAPTERTAELIDYLLEAGESWLGPYGEERTWVAYLAEMGRGGGRGSGT